MKQTVEVLVHPFDCEDYENQAKYTEARSRKLQGEEDIIILTSNPDNVKNLVSRYQARIMTAWDYSAEPIGGWEEYNKILKKYSGVVISGAELKLDEDGNPLNGCVMHAYEETVHDNKRIDVGSCWISKI